MRIHRIPRCWTLRNWFRLRNQSPPIPKIPRISSLQFPKFSESVPSNSVRFHFHSIPGIRWNWFRGRNWCRNVQHRGIGWLLTDINYFILLRRAWFDRWPFYLYRDYASKKNESAHSIRSDHDHLESSRKTYWAKGCYTLCLSSKK
jgi:hypothetical protein